MKRLIRLTSRALGDPVSVRVYVYDDLEHHASTALYGATLPDTVDRLEVLTHVNEPFAYLHGELVRKLVDRLYALGYYDTEEST